MPAHPYGASVEATSDVEDLFRSYVENPHDFWEGATVRQADKLERKRDSVRQLMGWDGTDVASLCLEWAQERHGRFSPVYVTGLGGSGSHWLSGMLSDLPEFFDAGEVYVPPALVEALDRDTRRAPIVLDALHVLHTRHPAGSKARAVNCAAGSEKTSRNLRWDPQATVVRLLRDPRDQVLSTAFRKAEYRQWVAPDESDADYLVRRCAINRADERKYHRAGVAADLVIKYEEMRRDAVAVFAQIVHKTGIAVDTAAIESAARRRNAEQIRSGSSTAAGNLDMGGKARTWSEEPLSRTAPLHAELVDVIESQAYDFGPCLGPPDRSEVVALNSPPPPGLRLRGWEEGTWRLEVDRSSGFLAEITEVSESHIAYLDTTAVVGVCAVHAREVPDRWLDGILSLPDLRTLDLGTVRLSQSQLGRLEKAGSHLRVLSLWRSCSRDHLTRIRDRLPATSVVG